MNTPATTTPTQKPDFLVIAENLITLATAAMTPTKAGSATFVNIPQGYTLKEITEQMEKAEPVPARKHGVVQLKSLESLVTYAKDQGCATLGYIYADPDSRTITAVFNDQKDQELAGWRDHRATYKADFTPEFSRWMSNNGPAKKFSQIEFAEFIESNFVDIHGEVASVLLTVATTLQAKTDINFSSAKRLDNGQAQLTYTEAINATAGANGALTIPKEFELGLRLFKNGDGYKLKARLKYRLNAGGVSFWYELDRPERAIEDAFAGYIDTVSKESGYTVLLGTP